MHGAGVLTAGNDAGISGFACTVARKFVEQFCLQLILQHPGAALPHGATMRLHGNRSRLPHLPHFRCGLKQPHFMEEVIEVRKLSRWHRASSDLAADTVYPGHDPGIEIPATAHGIVDTPPTLNQSRENVVDVCQRKGVIRPKTLARCLRTDSLSVPELF